MSRPAQVATACQPSASRCLALAWRLRPEGRSTGSSSARLRWRTASPVRRQVPEIPVAQVARGRVTPVRPELLLWPAERPANREPGAPTGPPVCPPAGAPAHPVYRC